MGVKKGKTFPGKKAGGHKTVWKGENPARRAAAAERHEARKADREQSAKLRLPAESSKIEAPPGLPAGWVAYKRSYQNGKLAGKQVLRFASADGKHVDVSTVSQAVRKDAAAKGYDPKSALEALERQGKQKEGVKAAQEKEDGIAEGGKLRKAVDAFREKHGRLDATTVANLTGWMLSSRESRGGQKLHMYKGPNGISVTQLVHVEASLGAELLAGREIPGLAEAKAKAAAEIKKAPRKKGQQRRVKKLQRRKLRRRAVGKGGDAMNVDEDAKKKTIMVDQKRVPALKKKILKN